MNIKHSYFIIKTTIRRVVNIHLIKSFSSRNENMKFRHELKYEINSLQAEILKNRLSEIMDIDTHTNGRIHYQVRSLYFDDYNNSFYYEKENGIDSREKFRIRIYNGSDERIRLELKRKESEKIIKLSCPITREQTESLIEGRSLVWDDNMDPLIKKFYILSETRLMRPKIIVIYDRIPFVYPDGNVRITLDLNITASSNISTFFDKNSFGRPIMPTGKHILEVKYDEFIPDHIFRSVQTNGLNRISFSKYYLCRKFGGLV